VVHVREGDRVIFTMKNRSHDHVPVFEPSADAAFHRLPRGDDRADAQKGAVGKIRVGPVSQTAHRMPMEH
jgi:hypothetical protein